MILGHVLYLVEAVLGATAVDAGNPRERLRLLLRSHIFLTEIMQPWFFFAYMEAKSFDKWAKQLAIASELRTEDLIASCFVAGQASGLFRALDPGNGRVTDQTSASGLVSEALEVQPARNWTRRLRRLGNRLRRSFSYFV